MSMQKALEIEVLIVDCGSPLRSNIFGQHQVKATDSNLTENWHYHAGKERDRLSGDSSIRLICFPGGSCEFGKGLCSICRGVSLRHVKERMDFLH